MTIQHVYVNDADTDHMLITERDYEQDTAKLVVDNYGDQRSITIPAKEFVELIRTAGFCA